MKLKDDKNSNVSSYSKDYQGIEEICVVKGNSETHVLTSNLALGGAWITSNQLKEIIKTLKLKLEGGDKVIVKSYKLRSLNKDLKPIGSPDCSWVLEIEQG